MPSRTLSRHCCSCILAPTAASHSLCTRNRCPPCKGFTPKLSATYEKLKAAGKKLSVVFCSSDRDQKQFQEYFGSMPADWYAVPPGDKRKEQLSTLFEVQGIPSLVILDAATGETINANARGMVGSDPEGAKYPWKPPPVSDLGDEAPRAAALEAVRRDGHALFCSAAELRGDRAVVLEAVRQDGFALNHASRELKGDRTVVLEAVRQKGLALQFAAAELRGDRTVVLAAVRQEGCALQDASAELRKDREVVIEAVRQNGCALRRASEDLREDFEVVLEAVRQNGLALFDARRRGDRAVVLEAVRQNGLSLKFATDRLRGDLDVVLEALRQCPEETDRVLQFAAKEMRNEPVLQPRNVVNNCLAGSGARAPVFCISSLARTRDEGKDAIKAVTRSVNGVEESFVFGEKATLGDLAAALVARMHGEEASTLVCLQLSQGSMVQPSQMLAPLKDFF